MGDFISVQNQDIMNLRDLLLQTKSRDWMGQDLLSIGGLREMTSLDAPWGCVTLRFPVRNQGRMEQRPERTVDSNSMAFLLHTPSSMLP